MTCLLTQQTDSLEENQTGRKHDHFIIGAEYTAEGI